MLCYLAGPIDFADPDGPVNRMRAECVEALIQGGYAIFDPSTAYKGAMGDPKAVMGYNEVAIERADCMLAMLPEGVPTVGTPMEIAMAVELGTPVAVVEGSGSMQLEAMGVVHGCRPTQAVEWLRLHGDRGSAPAEDVMLRYTGEEDYAPWRQHTGDAGFDLIVSEHTDIPPGGFADVPCGINIELPEGTWGMLTGRSSTIRKRGLLVTQGIIDGGYRGPMFAGVWNFNDYEVRLTPGERVAQLIVLPLFTGNAQQVMKLSESDRGVMGFGSTG